MNETDSLIYEKVQHLIYRLNELKQRDDVLAVYLLRSDETGQISYYSYRQKYNRDMRMVKALIITSKLLSTGFEDMDWSPLLLKVYYQVASYPKAGIDLADEKQINESFRVFDKRYPVIYPKFSSYIQNFFNGNDIAENCLLTDFQYFDWDQKKYFLDESLDSFALNDDLIYFASLAHMWCVDNYIPVPEWINSKRYYSENPIGHANKKSVHPAMLKHNVYVGKVDIERV